MTALADAPVVYGRAEPRISTPPLRELTPETTLGFEAIEFAEDVLGVTLLPWQRWWLLHALELKPDGTFRFRTILTLVARQNGKTTLLKVVALWAMYLGRADLVLGSAQDLRIAKESWLGAVQLATSVPDLAAEMAGKPRYANGEQCLSLVNGSRYMITATTRSAGRGLSVDLLILDELREQRDWDAWGALGATTIARPSPLTVGISNQGDDGSVVLNSLRSAALAGSDLSLGLFEWSAPEGCDPGDLEAWAQANPGMNHGTITTDALRSFYATDPPSVWKTEHLCQRVDVLDGALDPVAWQACARPGATLQPLAKQLVAVVEVAYDDGHVTLAAAAPDEDGRIHGEILAAWSSTQAARTDLPELLGQLRPRALGFFAYGPSAVLGADLRKLHGVCVGRKVYARDEMHPHSPGVVELNARDAVDACMLLGDLVTGRRFAHPDDQLLNAHVAASVRKDQGDGWRFDRKGSGRNDAAYAMAGAVHLAQTLPPYKPASRPRIY